VSWRARDPDAPNTLGSVASVTSTVATVRDAALRHTWRVDATILAVGGVVLRVPALLANRNVTFDDGQYGSVVLGLRDGAAPFRDLFSSQGPLHYPLLWVADLVGFRTLDGPRIEPVLAGAVATIAAYAIGRRFTTRPCALLAGGLVATSGSVLYVTGPLSGDGPALALALAAVAVAFRYRSGPSVRLAILAGALTGSALCVKLIVLPAALVVGLLLLGARRYRDAGVAVGTGIVLAIAAALPWGIQRVWDQSIAYHSGAARIRSYGGNVRVLLQTLAERDPLVLAAVGLAITGLALRRTQPTSRERAPALLPTPPVPRRDVARLLWVWLALQTAFLVAEPAMWRPHVSQVVVPLVLLAVLDPPPWRAIAVIAVVLAPWEVVNTHDILWPGSYSRAERAVVNRLRALPAGAWVISDDPGFAWRAERRVPGDFVDVSEKRERDHQITARVVADAARSARVCAVVIWSNARFGSLTSLPGRLYDEGYEVVARYGGPRVVYEKAECRQ
jgi:hypothetical protein